jgi:hypothetical protein
MEFYFLIFFIYIYSLITNLMDLDSIYKPNMQVAPKRMKTLQILCESGKNI